MWRTISRVGDDGKYSGEAQPLVHDGVAFIVTGANTFSRSASRPARHVALRRQALSRDHDRVLRMDESRPGPRDGKV